MRLYYGDKFDDWILNHKLEMCTIWKKKTLQTSDLIEYQISILWSS